jgi:cyclophilin family peptidyl-prolyl cis-trans isomerase
VITMLKPLCGNRPSSSMRVAFMIVALLPAFMLSGCNSKETAVRDFGNGAAPAPSSNVKKGIKPIADEQVAVIQTDFGDIVIELYPNVAPQMVERFKKLIQEGFYDGTTFHRINARAGLIQGGDPLSKDNDPENDGTGDSPYPNVPGEFSDIPFDRGTVGAARKGPSPEFAGRAAVTEAQARDTANCQFFITLEAQPQFDEDYTVFGRVIDGITNAEIIMRAPVEEETERPAEKIVVKRITLQPRLKPVANKP